MKKMKKEMAVLLAAALVTVCAACGNGAGQSGSESSSSSAEESSSESAAGAGAGESSGEAEAGKLVNYAEYMAADLDTPVVVETYVQAKQSWWEGKATLYTQDRDGGYFVYNAACSEEDYAKLVPGTKIRVSGYKGEWSGEIEILDASFEILADGDSFIAQPMDVTAYLGTDSLAEYQNRFVSFQGLTVEAAGQDKDGNDVAFLYNWDGSGEEGSDLYFNASLNGQTYTFTVESYLCDKTTEVYSAVKELKIGDKIDMEGFLYWYEGANPHVTSVKAAK